MNKKVIVRQNGFKDCGPSCLLSIMKYYGVEASHEEVSYILKTNIDGTNAYNIINGSKSFGFDGYGIHYTYDEIVNNKISFPIICHVLKNNMYHFIVIYEVKEKYLIVMDPASNNNRLYKDEFKDIYLNTSIVIFPIKKISKIEKHKQLFEFIFDYIIEEKNKSIKVLILSIITMLIGILSNYYTLICIDYILPNYKYSLLLSLSVVFLISLIIKNIIDYIKDKYLFEIEKKISISINNSVIRKYFNLPYQFFKSKSTGESVSRLNDLNTFKNYASEIILSLSTDLILIIISMILLIFINTKIFFIYLIELIIYFIIVILFKRILCKYNEKYLINESEYNKTLNECINGYETNKNINMLNDSIKKIEINNIKFLDSENIYKNKINFQEFIKSIFNSLFYIITMIVAIKNINGGLMSLGEFVLFNTIIYYFTDPIKNIIDMSLNIDYIKNIYNRINDLVIVKSKNEIINNSNIRSDIKVCNLSYSHNDLDMLFDNINFNIRYGEKFLIYGDSGIGKSTIMKILLKYFDNYGGSVYLGNIDLKDISSYNISCNFTYVSQNSYINNDTLKNNIIYGRKISEENYENVIKVCNLNNFRDKKKNRNEFLIEDNGFNISGGERQKIILARSILSCSNYFIFDEALSEVGVFEEKLIIKNLFEYLNGKTIIYISHKQEIISMFSLKYKVERSGL